jgi:hypothetical protein
VILATVPPGVATTCTVPSRNGRTVAGKVSGDRRIEQFGADNLEVVAYHRALVSPDNGAYVVA